MFRLSLPVNIRVSSIKDKMMPVGKDRNNKTSAGISLLFGLILCTLCSCTVYRTESWDRSVLGDTPQNGITEEAVTSAEMLRTYSSVTATALHSGDLQVPLSGTINLQHPDAAHLEDTVITVPVYAYLIHHQQYGYFLIDSGSAASYVDNPYGPLTGFLAPLVMAETTLSPDRTIEAHLEKQLPEGQSIRAVFFTHLHFDHTSGLPALPEDTINIAGKGEWSPSIPGVLKLNHFRKNDRLHLLDFESEESVKSPLGKAIDLFGDGSVWAVSTSGHSPGHVSYLINSRPNPVLIAGDASIRNLGLELGVGPGTYSKDVKQAQVAFERLALFAAQNPQLKVWAGHDEPQEYR